jgi:hypothetical protein
MGILPIFIIIVSAMNDILDFVTAFFPGINEVMSFIFNVIIGILVFFEAMQKKLQGQNGIGKMVMKRILVLLITAIAELPIIGLLPFQTIGAVVMRFMSASEDRKHAVKVAARLRQKRQLQADREMAEAARRRAYEEEADPDPAYS